MKLTAFLRARLTILLGLSGAALMAGCSSTPSLTHSGFLSDYSTLREVTPTKMNYLSPDLREYRAFIIDPVQLRSQEGELSAADRAEIAAYFRESLVKLLQERGYTLATDPGVGVARIRIALTNVQKSQWWLKVHPGSSLAGAGRGGASMEGEIIDATTGRQLGAVVQAGVGSQFTAFNYSTVSDIKSAIDQWVVSAGDRLDELRRSGR